MATRNPQYVSPSSDKYKNADKNGGKKSRPSSSSLNNGGMKKKKKNWKVFTRRNDITEALRRRGWRLFQMLKMKTFAQTKRQVCHTNNGSMSPVMSHTSASKIRKLARQDSRNCDQYGNIGHGSAKRGLSAGSP